MKVAEEEILGPAPWRSPYDDENGAGGSQRSSLRSSPDPYGRLVTSAARQLQGRVRTGMIEVNDVKPSFVVPSGGFKQSGVAREFGREALDADVELKSVYRTAG